MPNRRFFFRYFNKWMDLLIEIIICNFGDQKREWKKNWHDTCDLFENKQKFIMILCVHLMRPHNYIIIHIIIAFSGTNNNKSNIIIKRLLNWNSNIYKYEQKTQIDFLFVIIFSFKPLRKSLLKFRSMIWHSVLFFFFIIKNVHPRG